MNSITIAGHLGRDAETRFTPNGAKVTTLTIATNVRESGEDVTVWYRVTLWGDRWDKLLPYLKKGSGVIVIGELRKPQMYTDRDGNTQVSLEVRADVVKFSPFGRGQQQSGDASASQSAGFSQPAAATTPQSSDGAYHFGGSSQGQAPASVGSSVEDDLPF